jgi:hypothetical protein
MTMATGRTKSEEEKRRDENNLLQTIAECREELDCLLKKSSDHWGYEDPIYRFYHQSFKVYALQDRTREIVEKLQGLAPHLSLNRWFVEIVQQGTGKEFSPRDNENWCSVTRPIVEAFFHARYFLEMICRYAGQLQTSPDVIPSGWASVLYLYNLR